MRKIKKMMALVIAMVMVLAMAIPAMAADNPPTTGSITITNNSTTSTPAEGRTFKAYRILNATEEFGNGNDKPATGYAYTIPNATVKAALATKYSVTAQGANETDAAYEQRIIEAVSTAANTNVQQVAKDLLKIAKDAGLESTELAGGTATNNLPFGYYVIEETTDPKVDNVSAVMLDTNNPNVEIQVKADTPSLDKSIDGTKDTDTDTAGDVDNNKAAIGDKVPFSIDTKVPLMTGYDKYFFIVNDTLSKGLTLVDDDTKLDGFTVKIGTTTLTRVADADAAKANPTNTYYVVKGNGDNDSTTIKIVFSNFIQYKGTKDNDSNTYTGSKEGEPIKITYSAIVNDNAVIGNAGNDNTATLTYSNNPTEDYDHDNNTDEPSSKDKTGETPGSTTKTFVTGLKLTKVIAGSTTPLAGATFKIEGTNLNRVKETTYTEYILVGDGADSGATSYLLKDGTYTDDAPVTEGDDANADSYATGKKEYKKVTGTTLAKENEQSVSYVMTTGEDGILNLTGLQAGTYTLTELVAPTGYNKLTAPITIVISATENAGGTYDYTATNEEGNLFKWTATKDGTAINMNATTGLFEMTVENNSGSELPSTGGIGTTIFYVLGTILVLGAGLLLVTRRRMHA